MKQIDCSEKTLYLDRIEEGIALLEDRDKNMYACQASALPEEKQQVYIGTFDRDDTLIALRPDPDQEDAQSARIHKRMNRLFSD